MIRWLFSRMAAWTRRSVDTLALVTLILELALGICLIYGMAEVVKGLSARQTIAYSVLAIALTRVIVPWKASMVKKLSILAGTGVGVAAATTADLWRPFLALSLRLLTITDARFSSDPAGEMQVITDTFSQLIGRISLFAGELNIWGYQFFSGSPVQLEQPSQFIWAVILFAIVGWASWFMNVRNQPFLAVLPMTAILGYSVEQANKGYIPFGLLLAFSFVAIALFSHLHREKNWQRTGLGYSLEMRLDIGWITGLMGVLIFVTAAFSPSISVKEILDRIEEARNPVKTTGGSSFGGLEGNQFELSESSGSIGSLPSSHLISGSPNLLDILLYQIWVAGGGEIQGSFPGKWRTHTYQEYTGQGWLAGEASSQQFDASEPIIEVIPPRQPTTQLTVRKTSDSPEGLLVHAEQLIRVSQPTVVQWRDVPNGWQDYSSGTVEGQLYTVEVTWPAPGEDVLMVTGFDYPEWIAARYLQLPQVTPRVAAISEEFERMYDDPYSRAAAIEAYLRAIPYTLDVPLPPEDRDIVDYFLFDLQQGYCDYFATAMVVLARGAGLPARMVGGYARGDYDSRTTAYLVTGKDAHTWVEIYFNRIGWVEFEPTPARLPVSRESDIVSDLQLETLEPEKISWMLPEIDPYIRLAVLILILPLLVVFILNRVQYRSLQPEILLKMTKERLYRLAGLYGVINPKSATLNEIKESILETAEQGSRRWPARWVIEKGGQIAAVSTDLLADAAYRGRPLEEFSRGELIRNLIRVRRLSGLLRIVYPPGRENLKTSRLENSRISPAGLNLWV